MGGCVCCLDGSLANGISGSALSDLLVQFSVTKNMEACWFNVDASGKGQSVVDGFGLNLYLKTGAVKVRDHIKVTFVWRVTSTTYPSEQYARTIFVGIQRLFTT